MCGKPANVVKCRVCERYIDVESDRCPYCDEAAPHRGYLVLVLWIALLALVLTPLCSKGLLEQILARLDTLLNTARSTVPLAGAILIALSPPSFRAPGVPPRNLTRRVMSALASRVLFFICALLTSLIIHAHARITGLIALFTLLAVRKYARLPPALLASVFLIYLAVIAN